MKIPVILNGEKFTGIPNIIMVYYFIYLQLKGLLNFRENLINVRCL